MMQNKNIVVKKKASEPLAPNGRGWHAVPGEGVLNEEHFVGTPSSPLRGTSPARGEVNGGFTLIELLVVVLIIGILAAVAVPQYQVAVEKSKAVTIQPILKTLSDAQEVYYLENNTYATTLDELGIDIPGAVEQEINNITYYSTPDGVHYMIQGQIVYGGTKLFQFNKNLPSKSNTGGKIACYAKADSYVAQRVCKSFGVAELKDTNCGLITIGESVACKGGKMNL